MSDPNQKAIQISPNPNPANNVIQLDDGDDTTTYFNKESYVNNGRINVYRDFTHGEARLHPGPPPFDNYGLLVNYMGVMNLNSNFNILQEGQLVIDRGSLVNIAMMTVDSTGGGSGIALAPLTIGRYTTFDNTGVVFIVTEMLNGGALSNVGGRIVTAANSLIDNSEFGTIENTGTGTIVNSGTIDNSGNHFGVDGFRNDGVLTGTGKILGSWTDHGTVKPGNSSGGMLVDGNYYKEDGVKEIELGGDDHKGRDRLNTEHDFIDVTGDLIINGGTLDVSLIDDFKLQRGQEFIIAKVDGELIGEYDDLSEGALVGHFDSIYGNDIDLMITYASGDGNDIALYTDPLTNPGLIFENIFATIT